MADLIDREGVLSQMREIMPEPQSTKWYESADPKEIMELVDALYYIVLNQPTAKEQEIKHGKWEGGFCSVCGEHCTYYLIGDAWVDIDEYANYCPNCGAKMDLKE